MTVPAVPPARAAGSDPGDQPVRTAMAWSRTLLGTVGVCVLLVRGIWLATGSVLAILALTPALAAAVITLARQRALGVARPDVDARAPLALAGVVLGVGAVAAVLMVSGD